MTLASSQALRQVDLERWLSLLLRKAFSQLRRSYRYGQRARSSMFGIFRILEDFQIFARLDESKNERWNYKDSRNDQIIILSLDIS